jgi:hypothetical protein
VGSVYPPKDAGGEAVDVRALRAKDSCVVRGRLEVVLVPRFLFGGEVDDGNGWFVADVRLERGDESEL